MAITLNGTTGISSPGGDTSTSLATTNLSYTGTLTGGTGVIAIGTNQIYKDASGNVGIGTASPSYKLDVGSFSTASTQTIRIAAASGNDSQLKLMEAADTYGFTIRNANGGGLNILRHNADATGASTLFISRGTGYIGIGNTSPQFLFEVDQNTTSSSPNKNSAIQVYTRGYGGGGSYYGGIGFAMHEHTNGYWGCGIQAIDDTGSYGAGLAFSTSTGSATPTSIERARIDSSGNLLVGKTYADDIAQSGVILYGNTGVVTATFDTAISKNTYHLYNKNATNNGYRFYVNSNGGIYNFSANNSNLSDERVKTAITPAPSWLAKVNAIEVVNFKYKDQTHDDFNLGVIAQQVLEVAPEIINEEGFGETPEDGKPLLSIYETDLMYGMLKAIQELTTRLAKLEAQ